MDVHWSDTRRVRDLVATARPEVSVRAAEPVVAAEFCGHSGHPLGGRCSSTFVPTRERIALLGRRYEEQVDELVRVGVHEDDIDEAIYVMDGLMNYEAQA